MKNELEFTGERVIPGKTPYLILQEHVQRYIFATDHLEGGRILDVACGTGYGCAWLITKADFVVGVDISREVIRSAYNRYAEEKIHFTCASAEFLPFRPQSFQGLVSFETIEHLNNYQLFLEECSRVLSAKGILICSTPNKEVVSPNSWGPLNPFHVHEFRIDELQTLLCKNFEQVAMFSQSIRSQPSIWFRIVAGLMKLGFLILPTKVKAPLRSLISRFYRWNAFIIESPGDAEPGSFQPDPRYRVGSLSPKAAYILSLARRP